MSYWKKCIEEFVRGTSLFRLHGLLSMLLFLAFFIYLLPFLKWRTCSVASTKIHIIAMGGILCNEIMNERSKIWRPHVPFLYGPGLWCLVYRTFAALNIFVSSFAFCISPTKSSASFSFASFILWLIYLSIFFVDFLSSFTDHCSSFLCL